MLSWRKAELMRKIPYPWVLLKEPKFVSACWVTIYGIFVAIGIVFLLSPSRAVIDAEGIAISFIGGALFVAGGVLGAASLHGGKWYMERAAILFSVGGLLIYMGIAYLSSPDLQEQAVRIALTASGICALAARFYTIRGLTLDPHK